MSTTFALIPSPIGELTAFADESGAITGLYFPAHRHGRVVGAGDRPGGDEFSLLRVQLGEYFSGKRQEFSLSLRPTGTEFQRQVWEVLRTIAYGQTMTYGEIAARLGRPKASRAVGAAVGRNPISIVVPCHRVIGSSGAMTGFAGGLDAKRHLLTMEKVNCLLE